VMMERDDEPAQMRYAAALAEWGDAGGYDFEVHADACTVAALGIPFDRCQFRAVKTLSGGEQKRLVLESLLRGKDEVLLLDEPDNYLDVPGKLWLEQQLVATPKTVLMVSHDRELLAGAAQRIITVEDGNVWTHGGGFATYAQARRDRIERLDELRRRWDEEHEKLKELVRYYRQKAAYNADMASRLQAAVTRLRKFEEAGPPEEAPRDQNVKMRLRGGRTGKRAVICENLELTGLMQPFDLEVWYGERVAILGSNGSGKSHFLRLVGESLDGGPVSVAHTGVCRLGARVVPGTFAQTHARPDLAGRTPLEILMTEHALLINEAMSALSRYDHSAKPSLLSEAGFSVVMNLRQLMADAGGTPTPASLDKALRATKDHPNFLAAPFTCDGKQIPLLRALCNTKVQISVVHNGALQPVGGYVDTAPIAKLVG